jgi:ATP-dependent protease ClpP protease subunit
MEYQALDMIKKEMEVNSPLRDRRIFLNEEIDRDSIFKVMYWLDRIKTLDIKSGTKEPIEIILDTYGGGAYHTLALCSKIRSMIEKDGYEIITTVHTTSFSGGFWILICGSIRRALADSRIMVHNIISGSEGKHQDIIDDLEEIEKIWIKLKKLVTDFTNISDEKMEEIKKYKYDWYFWGEEAVKDNLKVVDEII